MWTLGIDIGGTSVKTAVLAEGRVVGTARSRAFARPDLTTIRAAIVEAVGAVRSAETGADGEAIAAVGVCAPGLYDAERDCVTLSANVPGIVGVALSELAREHAPRAGRVVVRSDAHAAAFDVFASEQVRGRLFALSLGTGVGACVLDDGVALRVSAHSPGHFGQIDVSLGGAGAVPIGPDGGRGGLEAYVGLPALCRSTGLEPLAAVAALTAESNAVRALVRALRIAHAIYRPDHIRLLGGVGVRLGTLASAIHHAVACELTSLARPGWSLACGEHDFHAAAGAARLAERGV